MPEDVPVFSVVIPSFNEEKTIGRVLESVLSADPPPLEIIVVDDDSSDKTRDLVKTYPVTLLANESRRGPSFTRNRGASAARGEFICFIDADVSVPRTIFQDLSGAVKAHPDFAAFNPLIDPDSNRRGFFSDFLNLRMHYGFTHLRSNVTTVCTSCLAIKKTCFDETGGFLDSARLAVNDEAFLGWRLVQKGHKVRMMPDTLVTHLKESSFAELARKLFDEGLQWVGMAFAHLREAGVGAGGGMTLSLTRPANVLLMMVLALTLIAGFLSKKDVFLPLLLILALYFAVNARQLRYFARRRPLRYLPGVAGIIFLEGMLHLIGMIAGTVRIVFVKEESK